MLTYVEFRSDAFPPYEGEEDDINPVRYGKRLAEFLSDGLRKKGFYPHDLIAEDWGWMLPIENEDFPLWIGCGNYDESPNGFLCFIEPHEPTITKFLFFGKTDTSERVGALQRAIDEILSSEISITDKHWSSHEEFNNPAINET
ncbi:MAG: hypothetical protein IPL32_14170 [Chloracidobacterium sp.]|nr:hypothetical protein [Chloracidobacterium sp.]